MKKFLFIAVLTALSISVTAKDDYGILFSKYAKEGNSESIRLGPLMMSFARMAADDNEDTQFLSHIKSIQILSLDECSENVKANFRRDVEKISTDGGELLMEIEDGEDQLQIFAHKNGDTITSFVMINVGDDPCLLKMTGSIQESEISKLVSENVN